MEKGTELVTCNRDCLCNVIAESNLDEVGSPLHNNLDDIYHVLGRDVSKSRLINDIELYLECEEDTSYHVPAQKSDGSGFYLPRLPKDSNFRFKVTFPSPDLTDSVKRHHCTKCSKSFTRETLLKDHLFKVHGEKDLFPCEDCQYKGSLSRHLQRHRRRMHRKYTTKDEANISEDVPKGEDPKLSVIKCGTAKIRAHLKDDRDETSEDSIQSKSCFVEIIQSKPETYLCSICNKALKTKRSMKEHVHTVHGPKEYICDHPGCNKKYAFKRDLRAHSRTHTTIYQCNWPKCLKTFRDSFNLSAHRKTHFNIKDIECPKCSFRCSQKSSLRWHLAKKHSET